MVPIIASLFKSIEKEFALRVTQQQEIIET
jgi:hypothetical protein